MEIERSRQTTMTCKCRQNGHLLKPGLLLLCSPSLFRPQGLLHPRQLPLQLLLPVRRLCFLQFPTTTQACACAASGTMHEPGISAYTQQISRAGAHSHEIKLKYLPCPAHLHSMVGIEKGAAK